MGKIILLNGPPSSGKDTAARHIRTWYAKNYSFNADSANWSAYNKCLLDRMSMPIKRAFAGTLGLPITKDGAVEPWESMKEEIIPEFGVSYRQWQIDFSENFLKGYRDEIFGQLLAARIKRRFEKGIVNLIVVPDCGFSTEIDVLYKEFAREDILLIRCHRLGFTFQGDSRSYVRAPAGCAIFDPINSLQHEYLLQIEAGVKCWLESPERMGREGGMNMDAMLKSILWEETKGKLRALAAAQGSYSSTADSHRTYIWQKLVTAAVEEFITKIEDNALQE
jgi:hypothetical protein